MNLPEMLAVLRTERDAIEEAIVVLERVAGSQVKTRGRRAAWLKAAEATAEIGRKSRHRGRPRREKGNAKGGGIGVVASPF